MKINVSWFNKISVYYTIMFERNPKLIPFFYSNNPYLKNCECVENVSIFSQLDNLPPKVINRGLELPQE